MQCQIVRRVAGKFVSEGITQSVHEEEHEKGIVCVSLGPGMVATDMLKNYLGEDDVSMHRSPWMWERQRFEWRIVSSRATRG